MSDGPHSGTHLLALHVGGVTRNTQSQKPNKGRDDCVISAGAARCPLFRHEADLIAASGFMSIAPVVNEPAIRLPVFTNRSQLCFKSAPIISGL
jgi:hypothetical protein